MCVMLAVCVQKTIGESYFRSILELERFLFWPKGKNKLMRVFLFSILIDFLFSRLSSNRAERAGARRLSSDVRSVLMRPSFQLRRYAIPLAAYYPADSHGWDLEFKERFLSMYCSDSATRNLENVGVTLTWHSGVSCSGTVIRIKI